MNGAPKASQLAAPALLLHQVENQRHQKSCRPVDNGTQGQGKSRMNHKSPQSPGNGQRQQPEQLFYAVFIFTHIITSIGILYHMGAASNEKG